MIDIGDIVKFVNKEGSTIDKNRASMELILGREYMVEYCVKTGDKCEIQVYGSKVLLPVSLFEKVCTQTTVYKHVGSICGNCDKKFEDHIITKTEDYCYEDTNGDVFTTIPSETTLYYYMDEKFPHILQGIVNQWKIDNGHALD